MIQIKFRQPHFRHSDNKFEQFTYWGPVKGGFASPASISSCYCNDNEHQQYIGINDDNCREIYVGDILNIHQYGANYPLRWLVVFNEHELSFRIRWVGRLKDDDKGFYDNKVPTSNITVFEIVGNIYETPEFLNPKH